MAFHETLKHYRTEHQLSQDDLAKKLFVTRQAISKWEQGHSIPSLEQLAMIASYFGVSVDTLTQGSSDVLRGYQPPYKMIYRLATVNLALTLLYIVLTFFVEVSWVHVFLVPGTLFLMLNGVVILLVYALKHDDYSFIAGYNPNATYRLEVLRKSLASMLLMWLTGAFVVLLLFGLLYLLPGLRETYYALMLMGTYLIHFVLVVVVIQVRYKDQRIIRK